MRALLTPTLTGLLTIGVLALSAAPVGARAPADRPQLEEVEVIERLGELPALDAAFLDHDGQMVRLGDLLTDDRPILLTLNYYRCTMLCDLQLNGLLDSLKGFAWAPGHNYRIVTVSIDPRETPEIARGKRQTYLDELGRGEVDWRFLVGNRASIRALADSVGFGFQYDEASDQYAHVAVSTLIAPDGTISSYIYGIEFPHDALREAILNASAGQIQTDIKRPILNCFHFDPADEEPLGARIMRIGGLITLVLFAVALLWLWRRDALRTASIHPGAEP